MATEITNSFWSLEAKNPTEQMRIVMGEIYPLLFTLAGELRTTLAADGIAEYQFSLSPILEKIQSELDAMFRQEKYVLFPYLEKLVSTDQKSDSCSPFKVISRYYTTLLKLCTEIISLLQKTTSTDVEESAAFNAVVTFRDLLMESHKAKERLLYQEFKSCSGCKSL